MKLAKIQKEVMKQDIEDLRYLIDKYTKEGKLQKTAECLIEMRQIQNKLKEGK